MEDQRIILRHQNQWFKSTHCIEMQQISKILQIPIRDRMSV